MTLVPTPRLFGAPRHAPTTRPGRGPAQRDAHRGPTLSDGRHRAMLADQARPGQRATSAVPAGPSRRRSDRAAAVSGGDVGLQAPSLLGAAPAYRAGLQTSARQGFEAESQRSSTRAKAVSVRAVFNLPLPPMELILDGRVNAAYSMRCRVGRWRPQAGTGPSGRIDGCITVEPVYRPSPDASDRGVPRR